MNWLKRLPVRLVKSLLWLLLILLLVLTAASSWLLGTEHGARWLFTQVPGLEVNDFQGRLAGEWHASRLGYESGDLSVTVAGPHVAWRPGCLLRLDVCLDRLHTDAIDLQLPEGEESAEEASDEEKGAIELPSIELPVRVLIADLELGAVTLNDAPLIAGLNLSARAGRKEVEIHTLQVRREGLQANLEGLQANLEGTVTLQGDWPLDMTLDTEMALPDERPPLRASARLRGSVADLQISAGLSSPWQADMEATLAPLNAQLPATLTLNADSLRADPSLPQELTVKDLVLAATGNMNEGWDIRLDGKLASSPAMDLTLRAHAGLESARVDTLRLSADEAQYVAVTGARVNWAGEMSGEARLAWRHFPWQRLMPDMEAPPVVLETLDLNLALAGEDYEGQLDARLSTPEGPVSVASPLVGDFRQIRLPGLAVAAPVGQLSGDAQVAFAEVLSWQMDLAMAKINPGIYVPQLPGRLHGQLRSAGQMSESGPELSADLALDGELRDRPLSLSLAAMMDGQDWQLNDLQGRMGDNRFQGRASQTGNGVLDGELSLAMDRLDQLWPGLEGAVAGEFSARDLLRSPAGEVSLNVRDLVFEPQALELASLDLSGALDSGKSGDSGKNGDSRKSGNSSQSANASQTGQLSLDWSSLALGEQQVESGKVRLSGSEAEHQLSLAVEHTMASLNLSVRGGYSDGIWQGALEEGRVQAQGQDWQMQSPASLFVDPDERVDLGAHCWGWDQARLCMEEQRLFPEQRLRLALSDLPTKAFARLLPPEMRWEETLDARVAVDMGEEGPRGEVWVDAGEGHFQLMQTVDPDDDQAMEATGNMDVADGQNDQNNQNDQGKEKSEQWIRLAYSKLRVDVDLDPREATLAFHLLGPELGEVSLNAQVDTRAETYPLDGALTLENLNLELVRSFADLQEVAGRLDGNATLDGTLQQPDVSGQVRLTGGRLRDPSIPMAIDDLALQVDVAGTRAVLTGDLQSGPEGQARINGEANWAEGLQARVDIKGDRLPVTLEPFAELTLVPDLKIRFNTEDGLFVGGRLGVPKGAITIRELPPSAIQVSADEEIAGQEPNGEPMSVGMDLNVVVGEEQVSFKGFGVTGNLEGQLRLGDDMQARGELSLLDGRYAIYGQRLRIRRARVIFAGPLDQPFLDIEAVRETGNVVAGVRLTGRADDPRTEVFSEPSMSEQQALSYLLLGRPMQSEGDGNVVGEMALAMGLAQTTPMTRNIGERVGIKDFQLETEGYGDDASVVAAGYITEKLSLRYGVGLFQPVNRIAMRYDLTERIYLEAASGLANSLDIFYKRDY